MQTEITLLPVPKEELDTVKKEMQAAFLKGLHDSFPEAEDPTKMGPVPPEDSYEESLYAEGAVVRQFMMNGERVGGIVLQMDEETQRNEVDLFYITADGKGIGTKAWAAVEEAFPQTKVWELHTPYFEKRNIHFYVNKCGFHIVEFNHKGNPGPNVEGEEPESDEEYEFFRFEKVMKPESSGM